MDMIDGIINTYIIRYIDRQIDKIRQILYEFQKWKKMYEKLTQTNKTFNMKIYF